MCRTRFSISIPSAPAPKVFIAAHAQQLACRRRIRAGMNEKLPSPNMCQNLVRGKDFGGKAKAERSGEMAKRVCASYVFVYIARHKRKLGQEMEKKKSKKGGETEAPHFLNEKEARESNKPSLAC